MIRMGVIETAYIEPLFIGPLVCIYEFIGVNQVTPGLIFLRDILGGIYFSNVSCFFGVIEQDSTGLFWIDVQGMLNNAIPGSPFNGPVRFLFHVYLLYCHPAHTS